MRAWIKYGLPDDLSRRCIQPSGRPRVRVIVSTTSWASPARSCSIASARDEICVPSIASMRSPGKIELDAAARPVGSSSEMTTPFDASAGRVRVMPQLDFLADLAIRIVSCWSLGGASTSITRDESGGGAGGASACCCKKHSMMSWLPVAVSSSPARTRSWSNAPRSCSGLHTYTLAIGSAWRRLRRKKSSWKGSVKMTLGSLVRTVLSGFSAGLVASTRRAGMPLWFGEAGETSAAAGACSSAPPPFWWCARRPFGCEYVASSARA